MRRVNTHEAKTQLSRLIDAVQGGEEIEICRAGKPVARLVPLPRQRRAPEVGFWEGQVTLHPGWEADAEIEAMFEPSLNERDPK